MSIHQVGGKDRFQFSSVSRDGGGDAGIVGLTDGVDGDIGRGRKSNEG